MMIKRVKTQEELDQCLRIRMEVFVNEQKVPADEELDEFDVSPQACGHMLALADGTACGTARWRFYGEETPEGRTVKLQRVAVLADWRGKGVGRELILAMEKEAREAGAAFTLLDGQCQAEPFYKKLGYETISTEPFYDAGILHVRMRKRLG
ncbi:acetyltransferase [Paenibacillus sp. J31TS4]|uniref:GNAT family N-acetyltransferase n=1 Tax=Paenibacillus sp. J31TS4 TaxID=2807195 RepID=UPI001B0F8FFF|nr:GNAT family N-acetyltransferase [Paenibacillus sp. J31TS4]GIP39736.1 acetyltransferase [Paenibacillus sp. J31TS4]